MAIRFSTDEIRAFARSCRSVDPKARAALRLGVGDAGRLVAEAAKKKAAFSSRIPSSIEVKVMGRGMAVVTAGGDAAPEAAPLENKGKRGQFRHPVFGHAVWVNQTAQPFLYPALLENADAAAEIIQGAVDKAIAEVIL